MQVQKHTIPPQNSKFINTHFPPNENKLKNSNKTNIHTSSQVGKAHLRESKALRELTSVVFWESTVLTKPSKTVSLASPSSSWIWFSSLRYLANSLGKPWRAKRSSRTAMHSSRVGRVWVGYGSLVSLVPDSD
ncbi:hypothetical protein ACB098_04G125800 [Castanea mollissima]